MSVTHAWASGKSAHITSDYTGQWCAADNSTGYYEFMYEDTKCDKSVISIDKDGFTEDDVRCDVVRFKSSVVDSVTGRGPKYNATLAARCHHAADSVTGAKLKTFGVELFQGRPFGLLNLATKTKNSKT
jgi:hypothetical protein